MRETVLGIALIAIATGVFRLISPENSFKNQIAFLIAAFFLLSCVTLFSKNSVDFSAIKDAFKADGNYVDFSDEADRMIENEIKNNLEKKIEGLLADNEIFCDEISVIIDISSSDSISIKQVRLAFSIDNAYYTAKAEELVKKEVGNAIEVITEIKG